MEILKLYDKNEDNTMLAHELFRLLTNLGEKLSKDEAKSLMKELCDPADDDGFMPFIRKYSVVMEILLVGTCQIQTIKQSKGQCLSKGWLASC